MDKIKRTSCVRNVKDFSNTVHKIQGGNIERDEGKDYLILDDLLPNSWSHAFNAMSYKIYSYALFQAIPIFFTTNHHNYARWMSLYALDLFNIKWENPAIYQMLLNGGFSMSRAGNAFA